MPVLLVRLEEDAVPGTDDLDLATASLAETDALGDEDGLAQGVPVPVGAGTGHEVHEAGGDPRWRRCRGHGVDVDREPPTTEGAAHPPPPSDVRTRAAGPDRANVKALSVLH